jgi:serine protease Do
MAVDTEEVNPANETTRPQSSGSVSDALADLAARARTSVVEVRGRGRGAGSGVVWAADGRVLTNHHVVVGTGGRPTVHFEDGRQFTGEVIAQNPALDLAMVQLEADDLPALQVGDSTRLRVGDLVFAVGHPWGHRYVLTAGIVSGLGRTTALRGGRQADYIRSDVPLAPGNSGGPLLNARGQVVGINSMIFGGDLSIAVPSHVALDWLATAGKQAYLGVGVRPVRFNVRTPVGGGLLQGALITALDPAGPASRAGIRAGDALLAVSGQPVGDTRSLKKALALGSANGSTQVVLLRDGQELTLDVALHSPE